MEFVGIRFQFRPLTPAQGSALTAVVDTLNGKITSLTAPPRDYSSDTWGTVTAFDSRGMWPERPRMVLKSGYHLLTESDSSDKGPTWYIAFVAPARV